MERCTVQHSKSATGIAEDIACLTIYTQNAGYTQDTLAPYKKSCRVRAAVKLLPISQLLLKHAAFCNVCMMQCAIICHVWLLAARMGFAHSKQSVMITKQAARLLACACFTPASSKQQRKSLKTGCGVVLVCNARRSRGVVYRVANSVEVLGACRQISHQRVVEDACMHATLASVISLIGAQALVPVNQL